MSPNFYILKLSKGTSHKPCGTYEVIDLKKVKTNKSQGLKAHTRICRHSITRYKFTFHTSNWYQ